MLGSSDAGSCEQAEAHVEHHSSRVPAQAFLLTCTCAASAPGLRRDKLPSRFAGSLGMNRCGGGGTPQGWHCLLLVAIWSTQHAPDSNAPSLALSSPSWVSTTSYNYYLILLLLSSYTNKSHSTSVAQKTLVAQNTFCAVLPRSVARFSSLLPLPTFSCVLSESSTSWSMCAACMLRLLASVDCSSEISVSDFSVALRGR